MVDSKGNGTGIQISFTADVQKALDGTAQLEAGLDDVDEKLDDVSDTSRKTTRRQTDDLEDLGRAGEEAYDQVGDSADKGFEKAGRAGTGAATAIGDGIKDIATDFDGSMESIGSSVAGSLSGVAAAVPGAAGVILGAGAAIAGGFAAQWQQATEETKKRISDMYDDMLQSGLDFLSKDYVTKQLGQLFNPGDDAAAQQTLDDVKKAAEDLGLSVQEVGIAWVTAGAQRDEVNARARAQLDELKAKLADLRTEAGDDPTIAQGQVIHGLQLQADALQGILDKTRDLDASQKDALDNTNAARDAIFDYQQGLTDAQKLAQGLADQIGKIPGQVDVNVRAIGDFAALDAELRKPRKLALDFVTRDGRRIY